MIQFNVSTAFLYGELEEEIYMNQPQGYEDGTDRVCKLRKSLYGLKQAPHCWNKKIGNFLKESGLKQSNADPCLYILEKGKENLFLVLYVDDGLIVSTTSEMQNELVSKLKKEFKITVKPATYFLGLEIEQTEGCIKVGQQAYTKKVLKRFNLGNCRPASTPVLNNGEPMTSKNVDVHSFKYRQMVGALVYLSTGTRPDIAYSVGVASRNLENPS
jgi:hypothetical protein